MKPTLILVVTLLLLCCIGSVYSGPKTSGDSRSAELKDLVHRMVQAARERYESGKLESADKILQASLEIDPDSKEAWYYLDLVQKAVKTNKNKNNPPAQLWYPTIPPKPANK